MRNSVLEETFLDWTVESIRRVLPDEWTVSIRPAGRLTEQPVLRIGPPAGPSVDFAVLARRWTTTASTDVAARLAMAQRGITLPVLLVTDFTNQPLRQACERLRISYVDERGFLYIRSDEPPLLVRERGDDSRPPTEPKSAAIATLGGPTSSRIVSALLRVQPPIGVRPDLAQASAHPLKRRWR